MSDSPSDLIAGMDRLWDELSGILESLLDSPEEQEGFSVKDIYAHLGRWDLVTGLAVSAHVDGRPTEDWDACFSGYTRVNARWSRQDVDLSMEEATVRCKSAHGRLMMTFRSLNNEDWDAYVLGMARDVRDHYRAHVESPLTFATN
jgi:hypothetical protein